MLVSIVDRHRNDRELVQAKKTKVEMIHGGTLAEEKHGRWDENRPLTRQNGMISARPTPPHMETAVNGQEGVTELLDTETRDRTDDVESVTVSQLTYHERKTQFARLGRIFAREVLLHHRLTERGHQVVPLLSESLSLL